MESPFWIWVILVFFIILIGRIPEPNSSISALAIIDGVTVPVDIWTAFEKGEVNDVPSIFGVMAQENDLAPVDVILNYTSQEYTTFIENK